MSDWQRRETEADLEETRASLQAAMERIAALEAERNNLSLGLDKANGRIAALEQIEGNLTKQLAAARAELDAVKFAAHMPDIYPHGLPSWINQRLYACYIGADISPEIQRQIESGRLTFPDAPVYAELREAQSDTSTLINQIEYLAHRIEVITEQDVRVLKERESDLAAARAALEEVPEWVTGEYDHTCLSCWNDDSMGHTSGCPRQRALGLAPKKEDVK